MFILLLKLEEQVLNKHTQTVGSLNTVEPLLSGHPRGSALWSLKRSGR